jgi:RHS repeat-associated protein
MQTFMDSIPLVKEKLFGYYESDGQARMSSIQVSDHVLAITVTRNGTLPYRFTGKELDEETGLYYYGARYLDPRAGRWLSADPAMGEYLPEAPTTEEARKRNGNLPGMGGIYNYVNMHVYHYAGNNPVKYTDPDGRISEETIKAFLKSTNNDYGMDYFSELYNYVKNGQNGNAAMSLLSGLAEGATDILNAIIVDTTGIDPLSMMNSAGRASQTIIKASKDNGVPAVDKLKIALHALNPIHNHTRELDAYNIDDMIDVINGVLDSPWTEIKSGDNDRRGFYDPQLEIIVIHDPKNEGSVMKYTQRQWEDWN